MLQLQTNYFGIINEVWETCFPFSCSLCNVSLSQRNELQVKFPLDLQELHKNILKCQIGEKSQFFMPQTSRQVLKRLCHPLLKVTQNFLICSVRQCKYSLRLDCQTYLSWQDGSGLWGFSLWLADLLCQCSQHAGSVLLLLVALLLICMLSSDQNLEIPRWVKGRGRLTPWVLPALA